MACRLKKMMTRRVIEVSDGADVSRLEQALHHVRDEIAKAVKALADYAREYWERNRQEKIARERDDRGWSRSTRSTWAFFSTFGFEVAIA